MKAPSPVPTVLDGLDPWSMTGTTGALMLADGSGGAVYLDRGRLTYAEAGDVCGMNRLLTASGRMTAETLRGALATSADPAGIPAALARTGRISAVEVEALCLGALYAALLALATRRVPTRFDLGARHEWGVVVSVDLAAARTELDRRRNALDEAWPDPAVDTAIVTPVRRIDGHQVALTALQWEIVVNSGRRRTPADLARLLGRDTYATRLHVRRLVRAGLVAAPVPENLGTVVPETPGTGSLDAPPPAIGRSSAVTGSGHRIPPAPGPAEPTTAASATAAPTTPEPLAAEPASTMVAPERRTVTPVPAVRRGEDVPTGQAARTGQTPRTGDTARDARAAEAGRERAGAAAAPPALPRRVPRAESVPAAPADTFEGSTNSDLERIRNGLRALT